MNILTDEDGSINVSNSSNPVRVMQNMGFSHSSYATVGHVTSNISLTRQVPMSGGRPTGPQTNTPGGWIPPLTVPNNYYLWSGGGFIYKQIFYTVQHTCIVRDGGEYCKGSKIVVISNPFDNPQVGPPHSSAHLLRNGNLP